MTPTREQFKEFMAYFDKEYERDMLKVTKSYC